MTTQGKVLNLFGKPLGESCRYTPGTPEPLGARLERIPFPLEALGETLKGYVTALQGASQAPLEICFASLFSVINHAAQALAMVKLPQGQVKPLSCFFISVADSGERKTRSDDDALAVTLDYQDERMAIYRAQKKAYKLKKTVYEEEKKKVAQNKKLSLEEKNEILGELEEPLAPRYPMLVTADPTIEGLIKLFCNGYPFVMLSTSEGGEFFGGYAHNKDNHLKTLAKLSRLWDGAPLDQVRKDSDLVHLKNQRLNLHISVQENVFKSFLGHGVAEEQGFISRILLSSPKPLAGTRPWLNPHTAEQHLKHLQSFTRKVEHLYGAIRFMEPDPEGDNPQGNPASGLMLRSIGCHDPRSLRFLQAFYGYGESRIGMGGFFYGIKDFVSKSQEHVLRIAATLTLFENPHAEEITAESIKVAMELVNFYMSEHLYMRKSESESDEALLLSWLYNKYPMGLFQRRAVMQNGPKKLRKASCLDPVLANLHELGHIKESSKGQFRLTLL